MKQKSLPSNTTKKKKRKILIGFAWWGTGLIMAGVGIAIGYAIWYHEHEHEQPVVAPIVVGRVDGTDWAGHVSGVLDKYTISGDTVIYERNAWVESGGYTTNPDKDWVIPNRIQIDNHLYKVSIGYEAFRYCNGIQGRVVIPGGEDVLIGSLSFAETGITSIAVPQGTNFSIDDEGFAYCYSLTGFSNIGKQSILDYIGADAFKLDANVANFQSSLTINGVKSLEGHVNTDYLTFNCNNDLGAIVYPKTITNNNVLAVGNVGRVNAFISDEAFNICLSLTGIDLLEVHFIGDEAFQGCANLVSANLSSVTHISANAFFDCVKLQTINSNPKGFSYIGDLAFFSCKHLGSEIIIAAPELLKWIGDKVFSNCGSEVGIKISFNGSIDDYGSLTGKIYEHAFQDLPGVTNLDSGNVLKGADSVSDSTKTAWQDFIDKNSNDGSSFQFGTTWTYAQRTPTV